MNRKLVLAVLSIILTVALLGVASYSWFTARVSVPDNFFSAGTLELSVTDPVAGALFHLSNMAPGDVATGSITVKNTGSLDLQFTAVVTGTASGGQNGVNLADMLDVEVTLASVSGSPHGEVVYAGTLADLVADPYRMHQWTPFDPSWGEEEPHPFAPGMTAQFDVQVAFNENAGNDYQGASWTGDITFYADQWENTLPFSRQDMVLWLDATKGVVLDENNRVSQWLDQSGKGNHAVQENPDRRPEYIADYLNGRPSLYFENPGATSSNSKHLYGKLGVALGTDFTIFMVTQPIARNNVFDIHRTGGGTIQSRIALTVYTDSWRVYYEDYSIGIISLPVKDSTSSRIISLRNDAGAMGAWMEGKLMGEDHISSSQGIQGDGLYGIGAAYDGSFMCTCYIAEFIVYNTALSDQERRAVEIYLSTKYGIPLAE